KGSRELLQAAPSEPSATLTPARARSAAGQTPEPSRMLEDGQCATLVLLAERSPHSFAPVWTACATHVRSVSRPVESRYSMFSFPVRLRTRSISPRFSEACV